MTRQNQFNRRQFVKTTALGAAALSAGVHSGIAAEEDKSANGKLQIGCIGTANRAAADVAGVKGEDIVALCDIDKKYLDRAQKQFPSARVYADYRELIAAESDKIDAITRRPVCWPSKQASTAIVRNRSHTPFMRRESLPKPPKSTAWQLS
jgi:hypothetical protein